MLPVLHHVSTKLTECSASGIYGRKNGGRLYGIRTRRVRKTDLKVQVEEELLRFIKQMDLAVNSKLPREEELARMLGVSRITLRSVLTTWQPKA